MKNSYNKFAFMMTISFVVMYSVMFLNVFEFDHVYLSLTRLYMTLLMISPMALYMILMMPSMYQNKRANVAISIGAILVFFTALFLLRTQTPVEDKQFMKAMIPHHSSAILTSRNANISDPELKKLAEEIILAQQKEIAQMKSILDRLEKQK